MGGVERIGHNLGMARKARSHPKPKRRPTFIKAWRKRRGYTLIAVMERLEALSGIEVSESQLSRIERGEQPYSQDILEGLAAVLQCEPAHLLNVNPEGQDPAFSIWETLPPAIRRQAVRIAQTLSEDDKTGTDD